MTPSMIKRLQSAEARTALSHRQVFDVLDDPEECRRLEAAHPDAVIVHRVIVDPPDWSLAQ